VPVAKVIQPHRQTELPQLVFRGFFEDVGQHNHELLSGLGLTDDEIAELEAQGVIGTAPAMHGTSKV
jgi:crotonobetainyl-CoA:carnitine CoA-transferase CaiB-like acyl-CoA transferase